MKLAALDLGSNSFHLLVARGTAPRELEKIASHKEMLRLGAVVQRHGRLPEHDFERALAAVGTLARVARAFGAERIVAVATSAVRSAENGREFVAAAAQQQRIFIELLSGEEEAELVYCGARSGLSQLPETVGVVDIGGGSVEVAIGDSEGSRFVESLPLGFLRLAHTFRAASAHGGEELHAHVLSEARQLAGRIPNLRPAVWVFSGGTARALDKLLRAEGAELPIERLRRATRDTLKAPAARLCKLGVDAARADTLGLALQVLQAFAEGLGADSIRISPGGLRDGVLLRELERVHEGSGVRRGGDDALLSASATARVAK